METAVVTIDPETPLKNAARILTELGISGLPVVGADCAVVGVLSETDILQKELGERQRRARLADRLSPARRSRRPKTGAETAGQAMTSPAVTISSDASVADAARTMLERRLSRLPVTEGDRLVGIVTRADLVRAFTRSDEEIAAALDALLADRFWLQPTAVIADVSDGHVTLVGEVDSKETVAALQETVRQLPGVVSVNATLISRSDDRDFSDVPFL